MALYPEYQQVQAFVDKTKELLKTNMTIQDIFEMSFRMSNLKTFAIYTNEKKKMTKMSYSEFRSKTYNTASKLHKFLYTLPKGSLVALKLETSPLWMLFFYSILMCGFKPLLLDPRLDVVMTTNIILKSNAVALITNERKDYPFLVFNASEINEEKSDYSFIESWENEVVFCTSGTMGEVKLVVFDGNALCHQINAAQALPERTRDIIYPNSMGELKVLVVLPFHHIFGFVANFLWYSFFNKVLVFPHSKAPNDVAYIAQKQRVTHIYSVPLFWDYIAKATRRSAELEGKNRLDMLNKLILFNTGKISKADAGNAAYRFSLASVQNTILGTNVRFAITGGGFIYKDALNVINGLNYPLSNGYGMTEIGITSVEYSEDVAKRLKGSIGKPLYGVTYKISPIDNLMKKKQDENIGELLVKSPYIHTKMIVNGEEKHAELDDEGYFHTGDIVKSDKTGRYFIKGRVKELIINANGENIFPEEIEEKFHDIEGIQNLCVVGMKKNKSNDEDVVLVIETKDDVNDDKFITLKKLIHDRNKSIGLKYSVNKVYISLDKLPLSSNRKIKRNDVKKRILDKPNRYTPLEREVDVKNYQGFEEAKVADTLKSLREIFARVLLLPTYKISDEGHWIDDLGGDSMSYVELVKEIEDTFHITFEEENYGKLVNIHDFAMYLLNK